MRESDTLHWSNEMRRWKMQVTFGLLFSLAASTNGGLAASPSDTPLAETTTVKSLQIPIQQFTLKNGLRVVLSEDHAAPTVSLCVTYDVGSRNEQPGHTGF